MAQPDVITYERLYDILRAEKFNQDLQKLPENFVQSVRSYLDEKTRLLARQKEKSSSIFHSEIASTERQLENVKKIVKELYDRREAKILQSALFSARSSSKVVHNVLDYEKEFYNAMVDLIGGYREGVLSNLLENKEIEDPKPKSIKKDEKSSSHRILRFIEAVPRFVAENLKVYGPFEAEDLAFVPVQASEILVKKKKAEVIILK